jgi:tetratricopeptide (TPR) repeat protein
MMFSINIYLRFALIAFFMIGGTIAAFAWGFWWAFPFLLAGIILIIGYFLLGTVQSAAMMLQTGDFMAADKQLNLTYFPQWLYVANRGYFYLLKGTIFSQQKDYETAEKNYLIAQKIGLPSDNEKAMVLLALTNFRLMKNNWPAAENFYRQLKALKVTEPMIKSQIKEFDEAMKQKGQVKAAMSRPGFRNTMGGGGKRPSPKNR